MTLRTGSCPESIFILYQWSLVLCKTVAWISGPARDGPSPGGHACGWGNNEQEGKDQGAEMRTKSRFPCFLATAFSSKKRAGNPQLAHGTGQTGNRNWHARAAVPIRFWSRCSPGKPFFLVVWASAKGTCFGILLNTWLSWCPPPESQMLRDRKGPKIPVALMTVHAQNPKGASRCTPGASRSPLGRKNMNWPLSSKKMYEPPMQDTARYISRCSQHPQGAWTSVQHPPSVASRGSGLQRLVMYPVKIISFNQWCVYS